MVACRVMPILERWRQEDQKLFSATMQVQGQPGLHRDPFSEKGWGGWGVCMELSTWGAYLGRLRHENHLNSGA